MAYKITFGSKVCLDHMAVLADMIRLGEPIPDELYRAYSFTDPLGREPGVGYAVLTRNDIDALAQDATHTVIFDAGTVDGAPNKLTLYQMVFVKAIRLIQGDAGTKTAPYLVHFADRRWELGNPYYTDAINKTYNVPKAASAGDYDAGSLNGGAAWTWAQIEADLWTQVGTLGTDPGLPYTPDGTPQNLVFIGESSYEALNTVLGRINCALKFDPTLSTNQFSIVKIGAIDTKFSDALVKYDKRLKLEDDEIIESKRGKVPYGVRVFFRKWEPPETVPKVHTIDKDGPYTTKAVSGIYHPLWDDMLAQVDQSGSITNAAALDTRATERKDQYFAQLVDGGDQLIRVYSGIITDFKPGSLCKGVAWRLEPGPRSDIPGEPGAFVTEVMRAPVVPPFATRELLGTANAESCTPFVQSWTCTTDPMTGKNRATVVVKYLRGAFSVSDDPCEDQPPPSPGPGPDPDIPCPGGYLNPSGSPCGPGFYGVILADGRNICCPLPGGPPPPIPPGPPMPPSPGGGGGFEWRGPSPAPPAGPFAFANAGGTGLDTYATGDILYAGAANPDSLSRLAAGSNTQVVGYSGGLPALVPAGGPADSTSSPAALTGNVNDYAPTLATLIRLTTDGLGPYNITGIAGGTAGRTISLTNLHATDTINITDEDAASAAGNRFRFPPGFGVALTLNRIATFIYDDASSRWRPASKNF